MRAELVQQMIVDLDALDALFAEQRNWTQHTLGRLCDGTPTRDVNAACAWCLSGGVAKVTGYDVDSMSGVYPTRWRFLLDELAISQGDAGLPAPTWNDDEKRTFADVKKLIADTRARLQSSHEAGK